MTDFVPASATNNNNQNSLSNNTDQTSTPDLIAQICYATALGWAMTELLGRCVVLKSVLEKAPPTTPDFSQHLVILSPIRDQRERARAVMGRILFLAKQLGIADSKIEHISDKGGSVPEHGKRYTDVLNDKVRALCAVMHDDKKDGTYKEICTKINVLLFYWDGNIQDILQEQPPAVYNGYTVGRGFSTLRWYIGIGEGDPVIYQRDKKGDVPTNKLISEATLNKLLDHLRSMSSYLPPLVPQALEYSLDKWGKAILKHPEALSKEKNINKNVNMKRALIKQAIIWHDLLTGERDPTTYVTPRSITSRYVWKIVAYSVPFLILGLFLAAAIAASIILIQGHLLLPVPSKGDSNTTSITDTVTSSIIAVITAATTLPIIRTLWIWGSKTATGFINKNRDTINTTGQNALNLFWQRSQQEAVNKATFVAPGSTPSDVDDGD